MGSNNELRAWLVAMETEESLGALGARCRGLYESAQLCSRVHTRLVGLYQELIRTDCLPGSHAVDEFMRTLADFRRVTSDKGIYPHVLNRLAMSIQVSDQVLGAHTRIESTYKQLELAEDPDVASDWRLNWETDRRKHEHWCIERVELSTDEMLVSEIDNRVELNMVLENMEKVLEAHKTAAAAAAATTAHPSISRGASVQIVDVLGTTTRRVTEWIRTHPPKPAAPVMSTAFLGWWRVNVVFKVHDGSPWKDPRRLREASEARANGGGPPRLSDDRVTDALALRLWDLGLRFYESPTRGIADSRKLVDSVGWTTLSELLVCEHDTRPLARLARTAHVMRLVRRCHQQLDDAEVLLFPSPAAPTEASDEAAPPVWKAELAAARRERLYNLTAWREAQDTTSIDHDESVELLTLLQYSVRDFERSDRRGEGDCDGLLAAEVAEMKTAIAMLAKNSGLKRIVVPEWFVPSYEVDAKRKKRHDADVTIISRVAGEQLSADYVVDQATVWSDLHHPNIAKFFGACHVGKNRLLLYENAVEIYPSTSEQWWNTWRSCALVLLYLLERNMAFADFSRSRIRVAHLQNKTVLLGNDVIALDQENGEGGSEWPLPSLFMANVTSLSKMIQDSIKRVTSKPKSRLLNQLCSACLCESPCPEDALLALQAIASKGDGISDTNEHEHQVLNEDTVERPVADVEASIDFRLMRFADVFSDMRGLATKTLSHNRKRILDGLVHVYNQMQTLAPPLSRPLLESLQRVVDRFYRTAVMHDPMYRLWDPNNGDACLEAQRVENEDFEILRDVANLCAVLPPSVSSSPEDGTSLRHWRAEFYRSSASDKSGNGCACNGQTDVGAAVIIRFELSKRSRYFGDGSRLSVEIRSLGTAAAVPRWFVPPYEVEIRDQAGSGGFATVCKGRWFNTDVIVKRVNCNKGTPSTFRADFEREADIWFSLTHPFVVKLYGACHLEGGQFFVCEYASQGTLMDFVNRKKEDGSYNLDEHNREKAAWRCLYDAALGLQYLHERGITHRDLKGDNILVGVDDRARLTDFGLSATAGAKVNAVTGAAQWKAPEVFRKEDPTSASDVYSFAMCIIEVRADRFPWGGIPNASVSRHVRHGTLPPRPSCFADAEWDLVERMARFNPQERLTMPVVAERLRELVKQCDNYRP